MNLLICMVVALLPDFIFFRFDSQGCVGFPNLLHQWPAQVVATRSQMLMQF